jgi:hypothetical protein
MPKSKNSSRSSNTKQRADLVNCVGLLCHTSRPTHTVMWTEQEHNHDVRAHPLYAPQQA